MNVCLINDLIFNLKLEVRVQFITEIEHFNGANHNHPEPHANDAAPVNNFDAAPASTLSQSIAQNEQNLT
jgi:hypothetical protein